MRQTLSQPSQNTFRKMPSALQECLSCAGSHSDASRLLQRARLSTKIRPPKTMSTTKSKRKSPTASGVNPQRAQSVEAASKSSPPNALGIQSRSQLRPTAFRLPKPKKLFSILPTCRTTTRNAGVESLGWRLSTDRVLSAKLTVLSWRAGELPLFRLTTLFEFFSVQSHVILVIRRL